MVQDIIPDMYKHIPDRMADCFENVPVDLDFLCDDEHGEEVNRVRVTQLLYQTLEKIYDLSRRIATRNNYEFFGHMPQIIEPSMLDAQYSFCVLYDVLKRFQEKPISMEVTRLVTLPQFILRSAIKFKFAGTSNEAFFVVHMHYTPDYLYIKDQYQYPGR